MSAPITTETQPYWALAGLSFAMLMSSLGTSIANVGLPTFGEHFNAGFHQIQWIVLAYLLAVATAIVSAGRIGDIFGRRRLLLAGLSLFIGASLLCAVAPTLPLLVAARAAQGLGAAAMMALSMAIVGKIVPRARSGRAMGLLGSMSAVGTAIGPSLGGILIAILGWRAIFLINLPLGAVALVLVYRHLPCDRPLSGGTRAKLDVPGTVLLGFTLATFALSMTVDRGHFGLLNILLLLGAAAGTGIFLLVETKQDAPLIPPAMFRDRALSAGLAVSAIVSTVMMTTLVVGPYYLSYVLGLGAPAVGLVMSAGPLVAAIAGLPAGRFVDRFGARMPVLIGLVGMAGGCFVLSAMPRAFGVAGYVLPMIAATIGYAIFQTANNSAVMAGAQPDRRGLVSGMLNLSRNLGLISGASVMGALFASASGGSEIAILPPASVGRGMTVTFLVAGALVTAAIAIATGSRHRDSCTRNAVGIPHQPA